MGDCHHLSFSVPLTGDTVLGRAYIPIVKPEAGKATQEHWKEPSRWWIADLNLIMYFRMMYGTVGNCLWQMCTGRGIISNNEKCSYYVILKRIRTPIIGKMIIPVSLINSDMEACAKDIGRWAEAVMDSRECWITLDLWKVAWCLIAGRKCATH